MIDTRFSTALQIVISVAVNEEANLRSTSQSLAAGLDTNASFVRKLLIPLTERGILASTVGNRGGVRLGRPPNEIQLSEIYSSAISEKKIWATRHNIPSQCLVSKNISELSEYFCDRAEQAVVDMLGSVTVEASIAELRRIESEKHTTQASIAAQ